MKYLFLYEDFEGGKFRYEDIYRAWKEKKPVFTSIVKDRPEHNKDMPLEIVDIDSTNELGVMIDGDIYYIDLSDIEKIGEE